MAASVHGLRGGIFLADCFMSDHWCGTATKLTANIKEISDP